MSTTPNNIVVYWIDEAPREDFLTRLHEAGIQVYKADNYVDGLQWLSNSNNLEICDAVILDINCKIRHSDEHESTDSFRDYAYRVLNLCEGEKKHIPWFVFSTGQGDSASLLNAIPRREWTRRQYYQKDTDQQQLIADIRELTRDSENVALRKRYEGVFDIFEDEGTTSRLYSIIRKMEDPKNAEDTTVFNAMRKLLAYAVSYGKDHGLFSSSIDSTHEAEKRLSDIHELAPAIVPSYILTNFRSLADTVNNGSHAKYEDDEVGSLAVDADVQSGEAKYLSRVAFYQLLTILRWMRKLPMKSEEIASYRARIDEMLRDPIRLYEGCECHLQYDKGVWHYGSCAVRPRPGHALNEQTIVRLKYVQANRNYATKKLYPFFAQYDVVFSGI